VNRLAGETSPYLLQHADNPVDWYPWGDEAFARAKAEDRPILLSIGYSACHWCHVMEHESFEDAETAALMNDRFVNVKVDREERPDVDGIYMDAVVALTGQGGWPMTVFLTPDGEPFFGGTYFPPAPRMGMPAFRDVLGAVADAYTSRPTDVAQQAAQLTDAIRRSAELRPSNEPLTSGLLSEAVLVLAGQFDRVHGGFGGAPKFPPASTIEFLLRVHARTGSAQALQMATTTLDAMAEGGIYDQLGGGFHRYSVDAHWLVPHFEKMLYDNALLVPAYLHAWVVTGEQRYREVVEQTLDYLVRELRLPEGGFASAQDADTLGEEGLTYVWTPEELGAVLEPAEVELVSARFGVTDGGNFEGRSILHLARPEVAVPAGVRERLLQARDRRPQPLLDDKALAAWNGLALAAFAEAGARLRRDDYLEHARALAGFLGGPMTGSGGRLRRTFRAGEAKINGYLEDYANVSNGLLELYTATGELRWLEEADRLARLAVSLFRDDEHGGFFFAPVDGEQLVARKKELDDNPTPSGNSMLASVLLRLARVYGDDELERLAVGVFRLGRGLIERAPSAVGHLLCALDLHFSPPRELAFVGSDETLREVAFERFAPNTVCAFATGPDDPALERVPLLTGKTLVDGRPAVYVCESFACKAPVTEPEALREALA
jgi:uncharacterized protein YyaL (SSP411 family)